MPKFLKRRASTLALLFLGLALGTIGPANVATAQVGHLVDVGTTSNNSKSNQSKVFFYEGKWWALIMDGTKNAVYIWRHDGGTLWTRIKKLDKGILSRYDAVLDPTTGMLSLLRSHKRQTRFYALDYDGGSWSTLLKTDVPSFGNPDNSNPVAMTIAKNGEIWLFRVNAKRLQAKKSSDGGLTWSKNFLVKMLTTNNGTVDAVTFSQVAAVTRDYVGVGYAEPNNSGSKFGFLYHRDGDGNAKWTDESALLPYVGNERSNNQICMTVDPNNNIYMVTKTAAGSAPSPRNALYKRTGPATWALYNVNTIGTPDWHLPTVAIDTSSNLLMVAGVRSDSGFAEVKSVPLGLESNLSTAPRTVILKNGSDVFEYLSVPRQYLNSTNGMMVTAGNQTLNNTWADLVSQNSSKPITVDSIKIVSNERNAEAQYTIPIVLTDSTDGTLNAGVGKISLRFPATTIVPSSILPAHVTVDGVPAAAVSTDPNLLEIDITTAGTLTGGDSVTIVIDSLAAVVNKQAIGLDSLQAWTSAQPTPVYSPAFNLVWATTMVTSAFVSPLPTDADSAATYTIGFRVGAHGRMNPAADTFRVYFDSTAQVLEGPLSNVIVEGQLAAAEGDSGNHSVEILLPAGTNVLNNDSVTIIIPFTALHNPDTAGFYTLWVATSVETSKVASQPFEIKPSSLFGLPIIGTNGNFARGNQSKTFYHDGAWWLVAQAKADNRWYLWKFDGLIWTQTIQVSGTSKARPDVVLDGPANKAYMLFPGGSQTQFARLSYSGGAWSIDGGYPTTVNAVQEERMNMVRGLSGDFWAFWIADSTIYGQRSTDDGSTWSPADTIKHPLNVQVGLTDAVAFQHGGANHIGLGYAENSSNSSAIFGFLRHNDSDPLTSWTDETASFDQPSGTTADDHVCMATHNNEIFMVIKTKGGGVNITKNALYHRETNGDWTRYDVIQGNGWTRPVISLDVTNNVFQVFGTREASEQTGEVKRVNFGDYSDLLTAPIDTVMRNAPDNFFDISAPAHNVTSATNLMLTQENDTKNEIWYNLLLLTALPKSAADHNGETAQTESVIESHRLAVENYPNPFNPSTMLRFEVDRAAPVKLQIFNLNGQLVRTLVDEEMAPGAYHRNWNARNQAGQLVATGIYLYRLQVGKRVVSGQMQFIK